MEDWKYEIAKKRVKKVKGFYRHFGSWLIFSAFFIILNIRTSPYHFWAIFPIMGWGLGVALHALGVFGLPGLGKDWEERMLDKEMRRLEQEADERGQKESGQLPYRTEMPEDGLELKEVRKQWRDSDLV
jgi:hypothetical protein